MINLNFFIKFQKKDNEKERERKKEKFFLYIST